MSATGWRVNNTGTLPAQATVTAPCDVTNGFTPQTIAAGANVAFVYQISGVDTASWTATQVPGASVLRTIQNGTYGRWRVMRKGVTGREVLIGVRVNSTTTPPEVMRLTDPAWDRVSEYFVVS